MNTTNTNTNTTALAAADPEAQAVATSLREAAFLLHEVVRGRLPAGEQALTDAERNACVWAYIAKCATSGGRVPSADTLRKLVGRLEGCVQALALPEAA